MSRYIVSKKTEPFFISRRDGRRLIIDKVTGNRVDLLDYPDMCVWVRKLGKIHIISDLHSGSKVSEGPDRGKAINSLLAFLDKRFSNNAKGLQEHLEGLYSNMKAECKRIKAAYATVNVPELPAVPVEDEPVVEGPQEMVGVDVYKDVPTSGRPTATERSISLQATVEVAEEPPPVTSRPLPHRAGYAWGKMVVARLRKRGVRKLGKWALALFRTADRHPDKAKFYCGAAYAVAQYR